MQALGSFFNASLLLVMLAAALDILANLLLARSRGFRRRRMGLTSLALVGLAFYCLSLAVRNMDLAVAYAMWGSFGILGTSLGGWIFFSGPAPLRACACSSRACCCCICIEGRLALLPAADRAAQRFSPTFDDARF